MKLSRCLLLLPLLLATGCSNNDSTTAPTDTTPTAGTGSAIFSGTLTPGGAPQNYAVTVNSTAQTQVTFGSLRVSGTNTTLSTPLKIGLGQPSSTDATVCNVSTSVTVAPALVAQINQQLLSGAYCVQVSDPGTLTGSVDFAVRVTESVGTPSFGTAGTDTFSSNLYPGGSTSKTFGASTQGNVSVNLTSVQPQGKIAFGLGIGTDPSQCNFFQMVTSTGGTASLSAAVETGVYCVRVFDPGGLTGRVTFNIQIAHP